MEDTAIMSIMLKARQMGNKKYILYWKFALLKLSVASDVQCIKTSVDLCYIFRKDKNVAEMDYQVYFLSIHY